MSFDRFVAISNPLRYAAVLTNNVIIRMGLAIVARATLCLFPVPFLIKRLNFCPGDNILSHSFCFHPDVMRWTCADITINICYGLYVVVSTGGVDSLLIILSYTFILRTVIGLASPRERIQALNTCVSHILAVFVFFIPCITMSMMHRFGRHLPHVVHALCCLCVPGDNSCAQPHHLQCEVQVHQGGHAQDAEEERPRLMKLQHILRPGYHKRDC
ncbi:Olfactory receptor 51I2 [Plecturocebus cupreus]